VEQIAREEDLSPGEVQGIFDLVNQSKKKAWSPMKRLSIDEISIRKGAKKFKTVVGCVDTGNLLEVIDSHKQKEIIEILKQQPLEIREAVEEVSVDMWGGFPKVIKEVFPNAAIVIDRFHVMMQVNKDFKKLCKKIGIKIKDGQYLLLKNSEDLEPEEKIKVQEILKRSVCLQIAYDMKEEFREIYENSKNVKSGRRLMEKWLRKAQVFYRKAVPTLRAHLDGICNYFINRTTSGVMEGINNKIKLILRQAYGFTNFENLRSRLLACFCD
jgi:transposase